MKKFLDYFLIKHYSFYWKICKLQSRHYRTVATDPLGTGRGSLWIHGAHCGNYYRNVTHDHWFSSIRCSSVFVIALTYITCCFTISEEHRRTCSQAGRITLTRGIKQYAHAFSNVRHQPINLKVSVWDFPYVDRGTAHTCLTYIRRVSVANMTKCTSWIINNVAIVWLRGHTHTHIHTSQKPDAAAWHVWASIAAVTTV